MDIIALTTRSLIIVSSKNSSVIFVHLALLNASCFLCCMICSSVSTTWCFWISPFTVKLRSLISTVESALVKKSQIKYYLYWKCSWNFKQIWIFQQQIYIFYLITVFILIKNVSYIRSIHFQFFNMMKYI